MVEWRIYYKCRMCGEVYADQCGTKKTCMSGVTHAILDDMPCRDVSLPPGLLDLHCCNAAQYGIADLVGTKEITT